MRIVQLVSFVLGSFLLMMPAHAGTGHCLPSFVGTIEVGTVCNVDAGGGGGLASGSGDDTGLMPPSFADQCPNGTAPACAECQGHQCNKKVCVGADDCKTLKSGVCQELGSLTCGSKT